MAAVDSQRKLFTWQASTAKEMHTGNKKNIIDINAHSITKSMQIYDPNINIIDIMHEGV